ncbi:hypothetical protein [Neptuniibacter sp. QD48_11]|uniref:hypothetical protein n=1 Tax=unclassified Neptuniibacter TaxID=2630693 RepID=UPI0039F5802C
MEIEKDLKDFLRQGLQLEYDHTKAEAGFIGLHSLEELSEGVVWVCPEANEGYYEVPAVSLSSTCEAYDPEFLLLWLPKEKLYGAWDCDHWSLTVFPGAVWTDIIADPVKYLNAQWIPDLVGKQIIPKGYSINEGMPF